MTSISTVCVNDYLSSCQTAVALRTADYKSSCWVYKISSVLIKKFSRDNCLYNVLDNIFSYLLQCYSVIML